ncbi:MAG: hypothetical protein ACI875_000670, partial [Planctomycetota bacterium]
EDIGKYIDKVIRGIPDISRTLTTMTFQAF